jgi:hypothetical protein
MKRLLAVALALAAAATASHAQTAASRSSNQLLNECSAALNIMAGVKSVDFIEATNCVGYIQGYRDGVAALAKVGPRSCVPAEATAGQVAHVIVTYLKDNPETLGLDKRAAMQAALSASYPCN